MKNDELIQREEKKALRSKLEAEGKSAEEIKNILGKKAAPQQQARFSKFNLVQAFHKIGCTLDQQISFLWEHFNDVLFPVGGC